MWVMCFCAKKKVFSEPMTGLASGRPKGEKEKKETSVFSCSPALLFSAACCLLLDKCLLVPVASFCPSL